MAYISGTQFDFENRLHAFPTGTADLVFYRLEGLTYTGDALPYELEKWNREYDKKLHIFADQTGRPF